MKALYLYCRPACRGQLSFSSSGQPSGPGQGKVSPRMVASMIVFSSIASLAVGQRQGRRCGIEKKKKGRLAAPLHKQCFLLETGSAPRLSLTGGEGNVDVVDAGSWHHARWHVTVRDGEVVNLRRGACRDGGSHLT